MADYSFMKTGFNLADDNEDAKNIVALITAFTENGLRNAAVYVTHAKRRCVTLEDIRRGMMMESFMFMKRPGVVEKTQEIKQQLFNDDDADSVTADEDSDDDEEIEDTFKISECKCALCVCMNNIYKRWESWEPTLSWEKIIKKHIDSLPSATGETG